MTIFDFDIAGGRCRGNQSHRAVTGLDVRPFIEILDRHFPVRRVDVDLAARVFYGHRATFSGYLDAAGDRHQLDTAVGRGDGQVAINALSANVRVWRLDDQIDGASHLDPGVLSFERRIGAQSLGGDV